MNAMRRALDRYWFAECRPSWLALLRIVCGFYAVRLLILRSDMLLRIAASSATHFQPIGVASFLEEPLSLFTFRLLLGMSVCAGLAFVVGFQFRISGPLFAGLMFFLLTYRNSWSMIYHSENLIVIHLLVLGITRSADMLSVDAWIRDGKFFPSRGSAKDPTCTPHWRYGWPVRLLCSLTVATYFLAGLAKVAGPLGWGWMSGDSLRSQVLVDAIRKQLLGGSPAELALRLYDFPLIFLGFGVGTILLELGAPFFLAGNITARLWAALAFLFHWGVFCLMGICFEYQLCGVAFAPFLVWLSVPRPDSAVDSHRILVTT